MICMVLVLVAVYDLVSNYPSLDFKDNDIKLAIRLDDLGVKEFKRMAASVPVPEKKVEEKLPEKSEIKEPIINTEVQEVVDQEVEEESVDISLQMTHAYNSIRWGEGLKKDQFFGLVRYTESSLLDLIMSIEPPTGEPIKINLPYIELSNVGHFMADIGEMKVAGLFARGGGDEYHLRFATGPLLGSVFYFSPQSNELAELAEEKSEQQLDQEALQQQIIEERQRILEEQQMNMPVESHSELNEYSEDVDVSEVDTEESAPEIPAHEDSVGELSMNEYAENSGFEF